MTWLCSPSDLPARRSAGSPALLLINVEVSQDSATLVITGELDLTTRPLLIEHLAPILCTRPRRLVLDMAGTGFIDCGSARLIASAAQFLPDGRGPVIRRPSRAVLRVLKLTGLDLNCEIEGAP